MPEQITKIVVRNGTDLQRRTANSTGVLFSVGEPAYCTDTKRLYIGDGNFRGIPVSNVNIGRVGRLFQSPGQFNTGFSPEAYWKLRLSGANTGDFIFDATTRTIYSLSGRSNPGSGTNTGRVPLTSDFVKYDISTLVNAAQFYYDGSLQLNVQDQGISYEQINSNAVDGITLQKTNASTQISVASGGPGSGIRNIHFRYIPANSLLVNEKGYSFYPSEFVINPGEVLGRTATSGLTSVSINQILNSVGSSFLASNGLSVAVTPSNITYALDANAFNASSTLIVLKKDTTITGNLSVMGEINSTYFDASASRILLKKDTTITGNLSVTGNTSIDGNTTVTGNLSVTGAIKSNVSGELKNMASFASPRINAGTITLFRSTYDITLVTPVSSTASGGSLTLNPAIANGTTLTAGTAVSATAATSLTNVCVSFGYKFV